MPGRYFYYFALLLFLAGGCEIFVDEIGGDGQPCSQFDRCNSGLFCNDGICTLLLGVNESCDSSTLESLESDGEDDLCAEDLDCIKGVCTETGGSFQPCRISIGDSPCDEDMRCIDQTCVSERSAEDILQPGTELYWQMCPRETNWTGWECGYKSKSEGRVDGITAQSACPLGYRLPTKAELIDLLGGCDDDVLAGRDGWCDWCKASEVCFSMFLDDPGEYWSSESLEQSLGVCVHFGTGLVDSTCLTAQVRCVQ